MRHTVALAFALGLTMLGPRVAAAQPSGSIVGYGAVSANELSSRADGFSGRITLNLVPGIQAVGEFGRINNVLPPITANLLEIAPVDIRVGATYAEGGLRFAAAPRSPIHPYVEATAGVARMNVGVSGLGDTADAIARAALGFVSRTDPVAGVGGGIVVQGGPMLVDLGYRYKQILADDWMTTVLGAGDRLKSHQVRVGIGIRF